MRNILLASSMLVALPTCMSSVTAYAAGPVDSSLLQESFSVDGNTSIPGSTLSPGSYVIRVVDYLSDRSILRVERADGKVVSTFLGVPNGALSSQGKPGPVVWTGGSDHEKALRGFNFPESFSVEFVYPKAEAVKIAVAHAASVEAVDPASDNLPSGQKSLSPSDMRIVTLWTLSPTRVNGAAAIAASKYKPLTANPVSSYNVARNEPPADVVRGISPAQAGTATQAPLLSKQPARRALAKSLPHTGSPLPLVFSAALLSLLGIVTLRTRHLFQ